MHSPKFFGNAQIFFFHRCKLTRALAHAERQSRYPPSPPGRTPLQLPFRFCSPSPFTTLAGKYLMAPPDQATSVAAVFGDAVGRKVDTRMLLFDNPTHSCEIQASANALNLLGGKVRRRSTRAAPRGRLHAGRSTRDAPRGSLHAAPRFGGRRSFLY